MPRFKDLAENCKGVLFPLHTPKPLGNYCTLYIKDPISQKKIKNVIISDFTDSPGLITAVVSPEQLIF